MDDIDQYFYINIIEKITNSDSVKILDVKPVCLAGENYVADLKRVFYQAKTGSKQGNQETLIFKKLLPSNSPQNKIMDCASLFANEVTSYTIILPALQNVTLNKSIPLPKCFFAKQWCLVFEDMQQKGYKLADKKNGLKKEELEIVLKSIGDLHARSFILKSKFQGTFDELTKRLRETMYSEKYTGQIIEVFWKNTVWTALESLRRSGDEDILKVLPKLESLQHNVLGTLRDLTHSTDEFKVICHGDLWSNNVLFRYDINNSAESACLLDLQGMRCSSCSTDLLHIICSSSEKELIGQHFFNLIDTYYESLTISLENEKIAPSFSLQQLIDEIKAKVSYGVLVGFVMIQCSTSDGPTSAEEINLDRRILEGEETRRKGYNTLNEFCHSRIRQLIKDLFKLGFL